jgi:hypothetical protein
MSNCYQIKKLEFASIERGKMGLQLIAGHLVHGDHAKHAGLPHTRLHIVVGLKQNM